MATQTQSKRRQVSFEEFCVLVRDGQKADLIDGMIYMASPDNFEANDLFMWLGSLLEFYTEEKDLGEVYGARAAFRMGEHQSPEPDVAFVRKDRVHLAQGGYFPGAPDVAFEIVSPESVQRDYETKKRQYETAGVLEYWIIDPLEEKVTLYRLDLKGKFHPVKPRKGIFASDAIPGFWLRVEWLWQNPLPKKMQILAQLLGA